MLLPLMLADDRLQIAEGLCLLQVTRGHIEASEHILLELLSSHTHDGRGVAALQVEQSKERHAYDNADAPDITPFHTNKISRFRDEQQTSARL